MCLFNISGSNVIVWSRDEPGHTYHVISAVDEWIMTMLILLFFFSFAYEFRDVTMTKPEVTIDDTENENVLEENVI